MRAIVLFIIIWVAMFTSSIAAYAVVQTMDVPLDPAGVYLPDVTPNPWIES